MKAIAFFDPRVNNGISGTVHFTQSGSTLEIFFSLKGFEPFSVHAVHIHEFGDLTEGCKSLGAHFNPTNRIHSHSQMGHAGDLFNNFQTDANGKFIYCFKTNQLALYGNTNIIGRSVVIHKFMDDLGLSGIYDEKGTFTYYENMSEEELIKLSKTLGYPIKSKGEMIQRFKTESSTTGNASTRIACGIIGWTVQ
jgi:Cu-Zn family superoxide dismutase